MPPVFNHITYAELIGHARAQENFNFHKLSAALANFGYTTIRLFDDHLRADFIARHMITNDMFEIQQKARAGFWRKYLGQHLWIAFPAAGDPCHNNWYLYDHDAACAAWHLHAPFQHNDSWNKQDNNGNPNGDWHWKTEATPANFVQVLGEHIVQLF